MDILGPEGAADPKRRLEVIGVVRTCTDLTRMLREEGIESRFLTNLTLLCRCELVPTDRNFLYY